MSQVPRIAAVADSGSTLPARLQGLEVVVERFGDEVEDAAALCSFGPRILITEVGAQFADRLGALRVLVKLVPELTAILLCDPALVDEIAKQGGTRFVVLASPVTDADLHRTVREQLAIAPETWTESYLQFVQGICDEINNPLMFASGHLQLLETRLGSTADPGVLPQVTAIRKGLQRIAHTMHKVRSMSRATQGERADESFVVGSLLARAEELLSDADSSVRMACPDDARITWMRGDLELLAGGLCALAEVGLELRLAATDVRLVVERHRYEIVIRMVVEHANLQNWELPRAFEPYQLNEVLRGSALGLNLFLVRLVTRAHGGDAVARRLGTDRVEFRITLGTTTDSAQPS